MSTAHRPTWNAAKGQTNQGGWQSGSQASAQFSVYDLPSHTTLKTRQPGQGTVEEVRMIDMKSELQIKEKLYEEAKEKEESVGESVRQLHEAKTLLLQNGKPSSDLTTSRNLDEIAAKYDDSDESSSDSSSEDDDDSDAEEEELMRELEKIKQERLMEKLETERQAKSQQEEIQSKELLQGNPLLQGDAASSSEMSAAMKRRWNDDVVFKNQSRDEPASKKRFINDVIRSDFHRRFLTKYIQ